MDWLQKADHQHYLKGVIKWKGIVMCREIFIKLVPGRLELPFSVSKTGVLPLNERAKA